jgi:hypothetical protein
MISKSSKAPLGLVALPINYKDSIFLATLDMFMVFMLKMFMEKTLPELLASVLTNETPLALILMLIKSSGPAT